MLAMLSTCDSFRSRQLVFEMYNVASLATNKQRLASTYDTRPCVALARELAGSPGLAAHRSGQTATSPTAAAAIEVETRVTDASATRSVPAKGRAGVD